MADSIYYFVILLSLEESKDQVSQLKQHVL